MFLQYQTPTDQLVKQEILLTVPGIVLSHRFVWEAV